MASVTVYRRVILSCLWFMFLMWIYGKDRKTQKEFDLQMEGEFDEIMNDPQIVEIKRRSEARLQTVEGQQIQARANRKIAKREMKNIIERSFKDE